MPSSIIIGQGGSGGSSSGSNASVGLNGGPGPTSSTQIGDIVAGVFTPFSAANPIPITGTILANNLSVGPTGSPVPPDATFIGVRDASGNLVGASAANPVRIDPTGTTVQPVSGTITANQGTSPWVVSGTVTANAGTGNFTVVQPTGTNLHVVVDSGTITAITNPVAVTGTFFQATQPVSGTITANQGTSPWVVSLASTTITGNVTVVQPTGTNLHVVIDSGSTITATVSGNRSNNTAVPGATNIGALVAQALTTPTAGYTTGNEVLLVTDLPGNLNTDLQAYNNNAVVGDGINGLIPVGNYGTSVTTDATWTSATGLNTAVTLVSNIEGYSSIAITLNQTGTLTAGAVTFEISNDNTNWYPVEGVDPNTGVIVPSTYTLVIGYFIFLFTVPAPYFRVRLSTAIVGSGTLIIGHNVKTLPQVHNIAGIISGTIGGALTNNNAVPAATLLGVLPAIAETAYNTVTYVTGNQVLPVTDLHGALNTDEQAVAGVQLGATAVVAFGTAPAAVNVPAVNAAVFTTYNSTPPTLTNGQPAVLQSDPTGSLYVDTTGRSNTFRGTQSAFTPLADASVPFFVIQGSATKTIKIRHVKITWACTTGNAAPNVIRLRRYTVISGGTPNAITAVPLDTNNAAATAVVSQYTVLPTTATQFNAGSISSEYMQWITNSAGLVGPVAVQLDFGVDSAQALTLRGVADFIGIEITAVAALGALMTVRVSWTEE